MKYIINERQYKLLTEEQEILHIPSLDVFGDDWETLQKFLERRGNPLYSIGGDLNLRTMEIESLGNLTSVEGYLDLGLCENLTSLGNLTSVGGHLYLEDCESLTSFGNLTSVGGGLDLYGCVNLTSLGNLTYIGEDLLFEGTPISKKYSEEEIRQMVDIGGRIFK
jgi:hypothetical protein